MILLKNCNLWTMLEKNDVSGEILIDGKKIIKVDSSIDLSEYGKNIKIIDMKNKFVMPGIVDPHCHVGIDQSTVGWAGNDTNEATNPVTPELRSYDAIKAFDEGFETALAGGVTTVCTGPGSANIIGGTFTALKTYGKTVEDMVIKEDLSMKMALGENPKRCYKEKGPSTRMASAAIMREALMKAKLYKEAWDKYETDLNSGKEAKKPEYNQKWDSLKKVYEGLPVKIHAHQEDDILTACRISKEFGLNSTIDHCTSGHKIADKIKEYGKTVILGPTLGEKSKYELKDKSFDSARIMYENGITFGIMTDHPVTSLEYSRTQAAIFVAHGLPYLEGLRAITINASKTVGLENTVGAIAPGYDADIVVYSEDPFHYMSKVLLVIVSGEIVINNL